MLKCLLCINISAAQNMTDPIFHQHVFLGFNRQKDTGDQSEPLKELHHTIFCRSSRDSKVQKSWRTTQTFSHCHASKSADGVAAAESLIFKPSDLLRVFLKHAMKHHTLAHAATSFQKCNADEKCKSWLTDVPACGHSLFHSFDVLHTSYGLLILVEGMTWG